MEEGGFKIAIRLFHLASFSGWLGTQLWVTFFAGMCIYNIIIYIYIYIWYSLTRTCTLHNIA